MHTALEIMPLRSLFILVPIADMPFVGTTLAHDAPLINPPLELWGSLLTDEKDSSVLKWKGEGHGGIWWIVLKFQKWQQKYKNL